MDTVDPVIKRKLTLTGWQRVFIVASAAWLGVCAYSAYRHFPTAEKTTKAVEQSWGSIFQDLDRRMKDIESRCSALSSGNDERGMVKQFACLRDSDLSRLSEQRKKERYAMLESIQVVVSNVPAMQAKTVGKALLFWLIPSVLLYLCVAWISAGFKKGA